MSDQPAKREFATLADIRRSIDSMWHTANTAFSKRDRAAFNSWRNHLWKLVDQLQDEAHALPDEPRHKHLCGIAAALARKVNEIPMMEE